MEPDQREQNPAGGLKNGLGERSSTLRSYRGLVAAFSAYWKDYGGTDALIGSAYFHVAAVGAFLLAWFAPSYKWWESSISIVPSMLGFSLAGYAIVMAIGAGEFQEIVARAGGRDNSVMRRMSAAYVHFLVVQALALILAVLAGAFCEDFHLAWNGLCEKSTAPAAQYLSQFLPVVLRWVGGLAVLYPVTTAVGATLFVFDLIKLYVEYAHRVKEKRDEEAQAAQAEPENSETQR